MKKAKIKIEGYLFESFMLMLEQCILRHFRGDDNASILSSVILRELYVSLSKRHINKGQKYVSITLSVSQSMGIVYMFKITDFSQAYISAADVICRDVLEQLLCPQRMKK